MKNDLLETYRQFRADSPFMLVGRNAELALSSAKTLLRFRELESRGVVRISVEHDEGPYELFDTDSEKQREEINEMINDQGIWGTVGEVFTDGDWEHVDSCWGHLGYNDPADPFENCYVIDHMAECVKAIEDFWSEMTGENH